LFIIQHQEISYMTTERNKRRLARKLGGKQLGSKLTPAFMKTFSDEFIKGIYDLDPMPKVNIKGAVMSPPDDDPYVKRVEFVLDATADPAAIVEGGPVLTYLDAQETVWDKMCDNDGIGYLVETGKTPSGELVIRIDLRQVKLADNIYRISRDTVGFGLNGKLIQGLKTATL
jgi:hypothetical protein